MSRSTHSSPILGHYVSSAIESGLHNALYYKITVSKDGKKCLQFIDNRLREKNNFEGILSMRIYFKQALVFSKQCTDNGIINYYEETTMKYFDTTSSIKKVTESVTN